jgi:hypothetical protein
MAPSNTDIKKIEDSDSSSTHGTESKITQDDNQPLIISLAFVQKQMRWARKLVKKVLNNSKKLRQDHLEDCARLAAYDGKEDSAAALGRIIRAEAQRQSWAKIRRGMGRGQKSGLSHILVEKEDKTTERISDKEQMEDRSIH